MKHQLPPLALTFTLGAVALGCADDERGLLGEEEPGEACSPIEPKANCTNGEDGSADEVGDGDGDGPEGEPEAMKPCTANGDGIERMMYQCEGHLTAVISFDTIKGDCAKTLENPAVCSEHHEFGVGHEPYEAPAVMACCDPELATEVDLLRYCTSDMVEQACRSVSARLKFVIENTDKDLVKTQVTNLLVWVNKNQQRCVDALHQVTEHGKIGPVSWLVNDGKNKDWPGIKNFTISLSEAVVESASLPADAADYLTCEDDSANDAEVFEERGPVAPARDLDSYHLGDSFVGSIKGPNLPNGGVVHGSVKTTSQSICAAPWCSTLEVGDDSGRVVIEDLRLYADGATTVTVGEMPVAVHRLTLRLYGRLLPQPYHGNVDVAYMVEPGAAHFLVSGFVGGEPNVRWVSNTSPLHVHKTVEGWTLSAFTVGYVDRLGTWEAMIPATVWD
jgi:hypothetical protein